MTDKKYPNICEYVLKAGEEKVFNVFSGFMLIYVREGSGTFCLNGKYLDIVPGATLVMSCLDYIRREKSEDCVRLTVLEFADDIFSGRIPEFFSIRQLPLYTVFGHEREKTETVLELISESVGKELKNDDIFVRNLLKELLIYVVRNCDSEVADSVYDVKTELAVIYIYSHFKESLSLEEVSAQVHYSANYFYHSFQKNTGTTFQKFLHNLRMDYAMNLIRFTDMNVSDICYECGYNSVQYFSTAFRKRFGKSPKNFINTN